MTKAEEIYHRFVNYEWNEIGEGVKASIIKAIDEALKEGQKLPIHNVSARLYSLGLNETLHADMKWGVRIDITRVPGGWIYQPICRHYNGKDEYYAPCFVPFNNEFQNVR